MAIIFPPELPRPSIEMPVKVPDPALKSEAQSGFRVTRARYTRLTRGWSVSYKALLDTNLSVLYSFYDLVKGGSAIFEWADEFGTIHEVRFDSELEWNGLDSTKSVVSFKVEKV